MQYIPQIQDYYFVLIKARQLQVVYVCEAIMKDKGVKKTARDIVLILFYTEYFHQNLK